MKKGILVASGLVVAALGTYLIAGNIQREGAENHETTDIKKLVHDISAGKAAASLLPLIQSVDCHRGRYSDHEL